MLLHYRAGDLKLYSNNSYSCYYMFCHRAVPLFRRPGKALSGEPGYEVTMPWNERRRYRLTHASVLANAPNESGVFGLCNDRGGWVLIAEASDLQASLFACLEEKGRYSLSELSRDFVFESSPASQCRERRDELIQEYGPSHARRSKGLENGI